MAEEKKPAFIVPAELTRLQAVASTDKSRPMLRGVYFDPERNVAVATDGNGLAVRKLPAPNKPGSDLLPHGKIVSFGKLKRTTKPNYTFLHGSRDTWTETDGSGGATVIKNDNFPDYPRVVPATREREFVVGLDAEILKRLADAIHDDRNKWLTLSFDLDNPEAFILIKGDSGYAVLGALRHDKPPESPHREIRELLDGKESK